MALALAALLGVEDAAAATVGTGESPEVSTGPEAQLTAAERRERATRIRDAAASVGMTNAVLLAGIAQVETGFAHCWSEATWACQGPPSSSCEGGPVIAGASDGPCADEQGGLGMFQFDAGTFDDTINTYGESIVTIEGNVAAVVPFLTTRVVESIDGISSESEALEWMNAIPIEAGNPVFEEWIYFVSWRYNGCMGCSSQEDKYRDGTLLLQDELGAEFWQVSVEDACEVVGDSRVIEEDDDCAVLGGDPQYWRSEAGGRSGSLLWTKTTADDEPSNYAEWRLRFDEAGDYEVFVFGDGGVFGQSTQAKYQVRHAGITETVQLDQSGVEGWGSVGVFAFDTSAGQGVRLDDNTGEPWEADPGGTKLVFDALGVERYEGGGSTGPDEPKESASGGICAVSTTGPTGAWPLLLGLFALQRRRRRRS